MKNKKAERSILYQKWKEEHREEQEKETLSQDIGITKEQIVVKKVSTMTRVLEITQEIFFKTIRVAVYTAVMLLASLGMTVLLNAELRKIVMETLLGYLK